MQKQVEQYGVFQIEVQGKTEGNPYLEYEVAGTFTHGEESRTVKGFYDGEGRYIVRFMPEVPGKYTFRIFGSCIDVYKRQAMRCCWVKNISLVLLLRYFMCGC